MDKRLERACNILEIDVQQAQVKELKGIEALYVYEPIRGGNAVIVDNNNEVLFANSSVGFEEHLQEFTLGRRS